MHRIRQFENTLEPSASMLHLNTGLVTMDPTAQEGSVLVFNNQVLQHSRGIKLYHAVLYGYYYSYAAIDFPNILHSVSFHLYTKLKRRLRDLGLLQGHFTDPDYF